MGMTGGGNSGGPPVSWKTLLGEHPSTRALKRGDVASSAVRLEFADIAVPNKAFKRVVRDLEFDVAELALMTALMARSEDTPLVLLPVVVFSRNPLRYLVYNTDRGHIGPTDLTGRRVGVRSYTTTTATWIRGVLAERYGVDLDRIEWVTCEEAHVAGFTSPPNVHLLPGTDIAALLLQGDIDAAIVDPVPVDPRICPIVPESDAVYIDWQQRHAALMVNHMVVVKEALALSDPAGVREVFRLLRESRAAAADSTDLATIPFGFEATRRTVDIAITYATRQHLLRRPLSMADVFGGLTATLS
jgi:4,5-dihydroxyphthalate decarboxylase